MAGCRILVLALATVAIAGCSDDSEDTTQSQTAATSSTVAEPTLPEPITAEGAESVKLADRVERDVAFSDDPDWMVAAFDSLWVLRGDGEVHRIHPETGEVIAKIDPGRFQEPLCQGIGASEDAIWACPALGEPEGQVVRIDPERNEVVSELKTHKMQDQGRLVSAAGKLWLLVDGGQRLAGVDLDDEKVSAELPLGETCTDLATDGTTLWAVCPIEGHVLRIDPKTAEIAAEGAFEGARSASVSGDLWVGFESGVAQVDPESLEIVALYAVTPAIDGNVYATDEEVWVRAADGHFLTRIDPDQQRIVETIEAPKVTSGGDVLVIGDSVWATAYDDQLLVQLKR
jgi:sugar lactone lactonase YvrE